MKVLQSDRFIPIRCQSAPKNLLKNELKSNDFESTNDSINESSTTIKKRQLAFSKHLLTSPKPGAHTFQDFLKSCKSSNAKFKKVIPCVQAQKTLDVTGVVDDFYNNCIDISRSNFLAIVLRTAIPEVNFQEIHDMSNKVFDEIFAYRDNDGTIVKLNNRRGWSSITSLKFVNDSLLMNGQENGNIEVHDFEIGKSIRDFRNHKSRVGCLQLYDLLPYLFYSGSKDSKINIVDLRLKKSCVNTMKENVYEICGLSSKGHYLASGYSNGVVNIWDVRTQKVSDSHHYHKSAVKALSWCPWKDNILVSGGGKLDSRLLIYNTANSKIEKQIETKNQVTCLSWLKASQGLIYSYGDRKVSSLKVHNYFNCNIEKKKLVGTLGRILGFKVNKNDENVIYSIASDSTLSIWNLSKITQKAKANEIINENLGQQLETIYE